VLIEIGILPNIELAQKAGDCAKRNILPYNRTGRLKSVHNAIEQGKQVASVIIW